MEKEKKNKKPNVVIYTILMAIVFIVLTELVIWGYAGDFITKSILSAPQGRLVVSEAVLAGLVLIVMLSFGNSYVFTQKKEKIYKGLFYGLFYLIGACIFGLIFSFSGKFSNPAAILNIALGCFLVGIAEEFLCRGWLLNEFLERFGDTKKGIIFSIFISGLIFGLMHFGNMVNGQDLATTVIQVINAFGIGVVLGVIYYRTKNIWTVILIHGLWDFSLFIGQITSVTQGIEMVKEASILGIIFPLFMVAAEILSIYPLLHNFEEEPKKGKVILFASVGFVVYFIFMMVSATIVSTLGETFEYDNISLNNYSITTDNYENYFMNYEKDGEQYLFELYAKDDKLYLSNKNTGYEVSLEYNDLYDYIILEEKEYFVLGYVDYDTSSNTFLRYAYIKKDSLSNDNKFLDDIKANMKRYLLSERSELVVVNDRKKEISYVAAYEADYGYYLLTSEDKMSILNRDK